MEQWDKFYPRFRNTHALKDMQTGETYLKGSWVEVKAKESDGEVIYKGLFWYLGNKYIYITTSDWIKDSFGEEHRNGTRINKENILDIKRIEPLWEER